MKTETCKLYSRDFWIFPPNIIKIDPYNFELYRSKVGPFFETQCSHYYNQEPKQTYMKTK